MRALMLYVESVRVSPEHTVHLVLYPSILLTQQGFGSFYWPPGCDPE